MNAQLLSRLYQYMEKKVKHSIYQTRVIKQEKIAMFDALVCFIPEIKSMF